MSRPGNTKPHRDRKPTMRARRPPMAVRRPSEAKPAAPPVSVPAEAWTREPWSVEWDRREEYLALSCLAAYRKVM